MPVIRDGNNRVTEYDMGTPSANPSGPVERVVEPSVMVRVPEVTGKTNAEYMAASRARGAKAGGFVKGGKPGQAEAPAIVAEAGGGSGASCHAGLDAREAGRAGRARPRLMGCQASCAGRRRGDDRIKGTGGERSGDGCCRPRNRRPTSGRGSCHASRRAPLTAAGAR